MNPDIPPQIAAERPRVTVAAIAERDGRFLLVRERVAGGTPVFNQPAGHLEPGESLVEGAIRETLEETGWGFVPRALVGVYQWEHPSGSTSFVRFALCGDVTVCDELRTLDDGIEEALWLTVDELMQRREELRSPLVIHCIRDYLGGERHPLSLLKVVARAEGSR